MGAPDTLFRSSEMSLVQLYVATEIGREVVSALGELGSIQFRDLNSDTNAFQRTFTKEIRRLDNVERQLRYFAAQMEKAGVTVRPIPRNQNVNTATSAHEIDDLADRCDQLEKRVSELNESYETLQRRWVELIEWRAVLREAGSVFEHAYGQVGEIRQTGEDDDDTAPLLENDMEQNAHHGEQQSFSMMNIGFIAGVISRDRINAFERILWRTLRGNLYMNQSELPDKVIDPQSGEEVFKNVFVIFAHGKEIVAKIRKISESLGADLYQVDEDTTNRRDQILEVNQRIEDLNSVLQNTKSTLMAELRMIAAQLASWMVVVKKEKAVYEALNKFNYDQARKVLVAEGWCPKSGLPLIQHTLREVNARAGLQMPSIINQLQTNKTPPTHFKTNKFTVAFQNIINAYGIAKYQEVNPGLQTIITFPFLFAVMFGDLGHGFFMLLAAILMIVNEKHLDGRKIQEIFDMAYYGRYMMLMMGAFSLFTGLIYNDLFSKPLFLFPSMWEYHLPDDWKRGMKVTAERVDGYTYPFGVDWKWHSAENNLLFMNSFKMKLSIILGWAHMTYSLCNVYINAKFFRKPVDIFGNFLPSMLFMQSIFGYLVVTVIYKWCVDWNARGAQPPSILNLLINMFLQPGTVSERLYAGQEYVQSVLLLIAAVCVPWLLLTKPLYLRWENKKHRALGYRGLGEHGRVSALDDEGRPSVDGNGHTQGRFSADSEGDAVALVVEDVDSEEEEEFDFGEIMIHQVIHTIEFCLNCISHTASYLRLWALSLAHAQLSQVMWSMTLANGFNKSGVLGVIVTVVAFYMWFNLTIFVLVIMEGTGAMLHSLRLAWVESMSKYFMGEGKPFEPFSFELLLEEE
ncbi:H(+)-transporting V0 sector ATPase subunit a [Orbilia brochopaga]|uniref:V-type proton ATPase subunit a n=1 Tax=Orbilia brochopaga TaxID=3140254 RepID=A0AAV9U472_9PEZI